MPLSRLSSRSRRTGLKKKRPAAQRAAPSTRHQHLWDAIRSTREEIERWQSKSEFVLTLFQQTIQPREQRISECMQRLTGTLIGLRENPARTQAERSLIGLWIIENLTSLGSHPFVSKTQWENLSLQFSDTLDHEDPIDSQLIRLHRTKVATTSDTNELPGSLENIEPESESYDEIIFDFGWHKKDTPAESPPPAQKNSSHHTDVPPQRPPTEPAIEQDPELDEKINSLENKLSVDRLFRQLAKVLHPDREQDEKLRAEKHKLMSQCLEARQKKDIDTLLELYCEHVGEFPKGITDDSHEELLSALELQLKHLQIELRSLRFGDALQTQIVERFSDTDNSRTQDRVSLHAKELDQVIRATEETITQLKTEEGLDLALERRRDIELDRLSINEMTGFR
ncbi:MAG: hypothetical protein AB8B84_05600 [Granulosicoccus sp.]